MSKGFISILRFGFSLTMMAPIGLALAEDSKPVSTIIESVLVIGARPEFLRQDLAGSVDVIGRDELDYEHVDDTMELFDKAPGVYISRYNQGIINTDISIRGFAGDGSTPHAKLLIDGIPSNLNSGYSELDQLFPLNIAYIQTFKGTSDPRYGTYNIAGNYNVTTRSDVDDNKIEATIGSYDARELQGYVGRRDGQLTHNYAFGYRESEGYRDHTDLEKYSVSGRWFYLLADDSTLGFIARTSGYEGDAPGYLDKATARRDPTSSASYANQDGGEKSVDHYSLHFEKQIANGLDWQLKLYWQNFERERWVRFSDSGSIQDRYDEQDHQGLISTLGWQLDDVWRLNTGADIEQQDNVEQRFGTIGQTRQRNRSAVLRDYRFEFDSVGGFVQVEHTPNRFVRWNIGYRVDKLSGDFTQVSALGVQTDRDIFDFGVIGQPKFNLFVSPSDSLTLFANYGRSFQHPFGASAYTSSDVNAQDVSDNDGWETGVLWSPTDAVQTRLSYWQQTATDELVSVDGTPQNVGETERQGFDLSFGWMLNESLELWGNYSHIDSEIVRSGSAQADYAGNELRSIPDYTASLGMNYRISSALSAKLHLDSQGSYYINEANLGGKFGDYTLLGVALNYAATWGDIGLQINNVFDEYLEYVYDFGQTGAESIYSPGDGVNASLSVSWKLR